MRSIAQSHGFSSHARLARRAVHHLRQPPIVDDVLLEGDALGAERALVDRMIGIAFDVHDRRRDVARLVAERVDDDAAADRAVRAGRSRLGRARDLQLADLGQRRCEIEPQHRQGDAAGSCVPDELTTCRGHFGRRLTPDYATDPYTYQPRRSPVTQEIPEYAPPSFARSCISPNSTPLCSLRRWP